MSDLLDLLSQTWPARMSRLRGCPIESAIYHPAVVEVLRKYGPIGTADAGALMLAILQQQAPVFLQ